MVSGDEYRIPDKNLKASSFTNVDGTTFSGASESRMNNIKSAYGLYV